MLNFFTDPYENELIYSSIARYHFYSGNEDYKDTIEECFGKRTFIPTLEFGGRLEYFTNELGERYNPEKILFNNTLFPYYVPFINKEIKEEILQLMKYNGSKKIHNKLGILSGSICKKEHIYYCPICAKSDIENYGESYIHREHQLQGIILCPHDGCLLKRYARKKLDSSRIEYIKFNNELLDLEVENHYIDDYERHFKLSKNAYFLLTENLNSFDKEMLFMYFILNSLAIL